MDENTVKTRDGRGLLRVGRRRDLAFSTLRFNWAESSGRIFSDQNTFCLSIQMYFIRILFFKTFAKTISRTEGNGVSQMSFCRVSVNFILV